MARFLMLLLIISIGNASYISQNIARNQGEMVGYHRGLQQGMMASSGVGMVYPATSGVGMVYPATSGLGYAGTGGLGSASSFQAGRTMGQMEGMGQGMAVGMNQGRAIGHTQRMMTGTALGTMYKRSAEAKLKN